MTMTAVRSPSAAFLTASVSVALVLVLSTSVIAWVQDGELRGVVADQSGAVVPGAVVTVTRSTTGFHSTQVTDAKGRYAFSFLPPGAYDMAVELAGFQTYRRGVTLDVGAVEELNVAMRLAPMSESVVVAAQGQAIDETPGVGLVIDREFLENMPLNGRTLQSLILMTPGVIDGDGDGQLSVNGMRTTANNFTIDGVAANIGVARGATGRQLSMARPTLRTGDTDTNASGANPAFNTFGGSNDMVQLESVEQIRVQTAAYSAQYGRQPGGQVQLLTRSGTNRFSGTAFEYVRDSALEAHDWFANANPRVDREPLSQSQFGGAIGGPIVHNHAFFFVSYEGLKVRAPQAVQERRVPAERLRNNPALDAALVRLINAYPLPQGPEYVDQQGRPVGAAPFFQAGVTRQHSNAYSIKVDDNVGPALLLSVRWNQGRSGRTSFVLAERDANASDVRTLTVNARSVLHPRVLNELAANISRNAADNSSELTSDYDVEPFGVRDLVPAFAPASSNAMVSLPGSAVDYTLGPSVANRQQQFNVVDSVSWNTGRHGVRVGADFRRLTPIYGPTEYRSTATFNSVAALLRNQADTLVVATSDPAQIEQINFSAYAQDTFRVTRRLTIDTGVRWEVNPPPTGLDKPLYTLAGFPDLAALRLAPAGTPLYPTRWRKLAPRVAAAYRLRQSSDASALLRASYGIFYDTGAGATATAARMFPYNRSVRRTQVPYPPSESSAEPAPPLDLKPPYASQDFTVVSPDNTLPRTHQWSVGVEQGLGASQRVTATYTGHVGQQLLRRFFYAFDNAHPINPDFPLARLNITRNDAGWGDSSRYHALQVQLVRRMSKGLQVLANYTLAKTTDTGSDDSTSNLMNNAASPTYYAGYSRNDRRHLFNVAVTYQVPAPRHGRAVFGGWATDANVRIQSAVPLTVVYQYRDPVDTILYTYRVDLVPGQALWIQDAKAPGGRRLNPAAFAIPASAFAAGSRNEVTNGNEIRNGVRGFGAWQADVVLRRQIPFAKTRSAQLRAEFFNVFNNPNFDSPNASLGEVVGATGQVIPSTNFGRSLQSSARGFAGGSGLSATYASGGARAIQLAFRLTF